MRLIFLLVEHDIVIEMLSLDMQDIKKKKKKEYLELFMLSI